MGRGNWSVVGKHDLYSSKKDGPRMFRCVDVSDSDFSLHR